MPVARTAVPIFFMITGYFLPDATGKIQKYKLKKSIIKILKIELTFFIIYLLFFLCHSGNIYKIFKPSFWAYAIIWGDHPSGHLWYLMGLLQALAFIYICKHLKIENWIYWMIPVGLALNLLFGKYNFLVDKFSIPNNLGLSRNSITIALPCILIGTLIRYYEYKFTKYQNLIIVALLGLVGCLVETYILNKIFPKIGDIVFFTIPLATLVFIIFLKLSIKTKVGHTISNIGKIYSMDIYLWHIMLGSVIIYFLTKLGLTDFNSFIAFIVMIISLLFAFLLKYTRFKKLYS